MRAAIASTIFITCIVYVVAVPLESQRIVGGELTTISNHPYSVSLLYSWNQATFQHSCGGSIVTPTAVLSAAQCFFGSPPIAWRSRIGSSFANRGGTVHLTRIIISHPGFNPFSLDNDIAMVRTQIDIIYVANAVARIPIAGDTYSVPDNVVVFAIGWGRISYDGHKSEQLRRVQVWTVNQELCRLRYAELGITVADNMLCSGWLDVGGRGQCQEDVGGPLLHNGIVVGVFSWSQLCALGRYPAVSTRVSDHTEWIVNSVAD